MYGIEEPFLAAEVAYRRERITADFAGADQRRHRRKIRVARRHRLFRGPSLSAREGIA